MWSNDGNDGEKKNLFNVYNSFFKLLFLICHPIACVYSVQCTMYIMRRKCRSRWKTINGIRSFHKCLTDETEKCYVKNQHEANSEQRRTSEKSKIKKRRKTANQRGKNSRFCISHRTWGFNVPFAVDIQDLSAFRSSTTIHNSMCYDAAYCWLLMLCI